MTIYAGGNDILRPRISVDAVVARYGEAVARLAAAGAKVLLFTGFDLGFAPVFRHLRGRVATYNELVREVADVHGATIVDFWRLREYRDPRLWDVDRLHMSSAGHQRMAIEVLDTLGVAARPGAGRAGARCRRWTAASAGTPTSPGPGARRAVGAAAAARDLLRRRPRAALARPHRPVRR